MKYAIKLFATVLIFSAVLMYSATAFATTTHPQFDSHGRLKSFEISTGESAAITYDSNGNILSFDFDDSQTGHFTVTFNPNGGTFVNPQSATRTILPARSIDILPRGIPNTLYREGYRFAGWFENLSVPATRWQDNKIVTANVTLHAQWIPTPANFVLGDSERNGFVTSADATMLARHIVNHGVLPVNHIAQDVDICLLASDLNGDGLVTLDDLIALSRWLVGFPLHHD